MSLVLAGCLAVAQIPGAEDKIETPVWKHGMDLRARRAGEDKFDKATKTYGLEVFADPNTGKLVYITENGNAAVVTGTAPGGENAKEFEWLHAFELRVRKAGEENFSDTTRKFGVEVYRDENAGNLVYVSETGSIAVVPGGPDVTAGDAKEPKKPDWRHGLWVRARKAGEAEFSDKTQRYGLEVFVDPYNGNLIYITEIGTIAVIPGTGLPPQPARVKTPEWLHGMELMVRRGVDADFNDRTPKTGVEVYHDPNVNKLVLVTETGALSLLNGTTTDSADKTPKWKHGLLLAARKAGEKKFDETTTKFGIEVYTDEITNAMIYIVQTGSIGAVSLK